MNSREYQKLILEKLLSKYNKRIAGSVNTNRRIILKPSELCKKYDDYNADISEKDALEEAVQKLLGQEFISVSRLKYSSDIEKIFLNSDQIDHIHEYLNTEFGIALKQDVDDIVQQILDEYKDGGTLTSCYDKLVRGQIAIPGAKPDTGRIKRNFQMLDFLDKNKKSLYIREASMLVYGESKWFEENNLDEICSIARNVFGEPMQHKEQPDSKTIENSRECDIPIQNWNEGLTDRSEDVLQHYGVVSSEQDIFIKGAFKIELSNNKQNILDIGELSGGIAVSSVDIPNITRISIDSQRLITVENKTSYQRMTSETDSYMYLGGFANRHQISFLKKVIADNPSVIYAHFGDIDIGGFLIHKNLCEMTGCKFKLYKMGIAQLSDPRFSHCLLPLTENDLIRMKSLMETLDYAQILVYMKKNNVKLEQEIVSLLQ